MVIKLSGIELDATSYTAVVRGVPVYLHPTYHAILSFLMQNPNKFFSTKEIGLAVSEEEVSRNIVINRVNELRKKIETDPAHPLLIVSSKGYGYRFCTAIEEESPKVKGLVLDRVRQKAWLDGEEVLMSQQRYLLLEFLADNEGQPCSPAEIYSHLWEDQRVHHHLPYVLISQLRMSLGPKGRLLIKTKKGEGWYIPQQWLCHQPN
jgi:DNA-binding response OmpR family regulator